MAAQFAGAWRDEAATVDRLLRLVRRAGLRRPAATCVEADDADGRTWRILLDLGSGSLGPLQRYADPRT